MLAHPVAAVAVVGAGRLTAVNVPWRRLFAMAADAPVHGATTASLFASVQVAERFDRTLAERLRAPFDAGDADVHATVEHPLVRADGTGFLGEVLVWPVASTDDAIWQVRDITAERALHAALRDREDYHRALQQHQRDLTFVIDRKGRIAHVSPSVDATLGHPPGSLVGEKFATLFEPGHRSETERWLRQQAIRRLRDDPGAAEDFRLHVVARDGGRRILACHPHDSFDVPGLSGLVVHARDVTVECEEAALREAVAARDDRLRQRRRDRLAALAGPAPDGPDRVAALLEAACGDLDVATAVWSVAARDEPPRVVARHPAGGDAALVGVVGRPPQACVAVDDVHADDVAHGADAGRGPWRLAGSGLAAFVDVEVALDASTRGHLTVGATERRAWVPAETDHVASLAPLIALAWKASDDAARRRLDPLTSLIGRVDAERRLADRIAERVADRVAHPALVVLVVDVDRLRDLNDRHGHDVGDRVVAGVASRLRARVGDAGFVARIDGGEFLAVLDETDASATQAWIESVLQDIAGVAPVEVPRLEASIGAARLAVDGADARSLWHKADLALREAKARGRGQAVFFDPRMAAALAARTALGAEIEGALERDEFAVFYQPQMSLASGRLVGLEALLRWQHPERGLLLPHLFIQAAIDRGLIDAVTKVAFGQVCEQIVRWQRLEGFPGVPVSVNVSARQFHDRRLPALVAAALLRTGLPARLLMLESSGQELVVDGVATERVVRELSHLGVRIALGSFGLESGSLRLLHRLGVSQIKVDRGFVERLPDDRESAIAVAAAIEIGRRLACQVVAEGVETLAQADCLRNLGCEAGQGFHFGAPLSAAELESFVAASGPDAAG